MIEPSLLATTAVALALTAALRRRQLLELRWQPNRHTWVALAAGLLPALMSGLALLLSQRSLAYQLLLWLGIFGFCGFVVPWG